MTFIVPFPPGGPVDTTARFATQPLGRLWSVPTVVDNKSGAGGIVGAQFAAKAEPDGYSLFFASIHHAVLPSLRDNLSYDILRDFEPVGMAAVFPIVLVVNPSMPVNSVSELIAYAKAQPGKLSFSSSGTGGGTHLAGELFNAMAGTRIQHVPYRGSAPAMQDLVGGQVQLMFADGPSAVPQLKAGKVRALGVGNLRRSALLPDVPTIAESGLPDYEAYSWSGMMAPRGTPAAIVAKVNADLVQVLSDPATASSMIAAGAEPAGHAAGVRRFRRGRDRKVARGDPQGGHSRGMNAPRAASRMGEARGPAARRWFRNGQRASVGLDVGAAYHVGPQGIFLVDALLQGARIAGVDGVAAVCHGLAERGIARDLGQRLGQPLVHRVRQLLRADQRIPAHHFIVLQAGLDHRGHVGQLGIASARRDGQRARLLMKGIAVLVMSNMKVILPLITSTMAGELPR